MQLGDYTHRQNVMGSHLTEIAYCSIDSDDFFPFV